MLDENYMVVKVGGINHVLNGLPVQQVDFGKLLRKDFANSVSFIISARRLTMLNLSFLFDTIRRGWALITICFRNFLIRLDFSVIDLNLDRACSLHLGFECA